MKILNKVQGNEKFKMSKWMECTWRRIACGKNACPVCGRIKKDRQQHIERRENPNDVKFVLEDVDHNFKEALKMIKIDAQSLGIDITNIDDIQEPPEPEEFPFYQKVKEWNKDVFKLTNEAEFSGNWWIYTEAAADLFWYANTLLAKVYRQLCNRWHIENGDDYGEFDYQYTKYVLRECLKILKKSLKELTNGSQFQKENFNSLLTLLLKIENEMIKI